MTINLNKAQELLDKAFALDDQWNAFQDARSDLATYLEYEKNPQEFTKYLPEPKKSLKWYAVALTAALEDLCKSASMLTRTESSFLLMDENVSPKQRL